LDTVCLNAAHIWQYRSVAVIGYSFVADIQDGI